MMFRVGNLLTSLGRFQLFWHRIMVGEDKGVKLVHVSRLGIRTHSRKIIYSIVREERKNKDPVGFISNLLDGYQ